VQQRRIQIEGQTLVAIVTGHGLKDPDAVISRAAQIQRIPANVRALEEVIGDAD
jgi:threonine synthase